jgi:glycosyltransferase involved in cell wall biosynthesis
VKQLQRDGIEVFHGLSGELPVGIRKAGIKTVVTIHDLIFLRHPEYYNWLDTKMYAWKFRQTLQEADRIVAISECTQRDIVELGGVDPSRIDIIYQSCAERFSRETDPQKMEIVRQKYQLPERYVLSVGSIEQRKNTLLALKALHWLPGEMHLVLVGKPTEYVKKLVSYANKNNLASRLHLLHGVPDEDLPALYSRAEVFVYPSRYEGFGIPIIEAIRMGLPVVGCTGSCLEEAGGPDNLYVAPDDANGMANAIMGLRIGEPGREERIARSREYIKRFENNDAARHFVELYQELSSV